MTKKTILVCSVLLLSVLTFTSIVYAFFVYKRDVGSVEVTTAKIRTDLCFAYNLDKGIPGETVIVCGNEDENVIKKEVGSADYIYRLTYEVVYEAGDNTEYITDLMLNKEKIIDLGLIKAESYNLQTQRVTYFGRHIGEDELILGELLATFEVLTSSSMKKPFTINASVEACQITEEAVKDMFGIDSVCDGGMYAGLFE